MNPVLFKLGINKTEDHGSKWKLVEEDGDDVDYQMLYEDMSCWMRMVVKAMVLVTIWIMNPERI
jgi:hypothetical protein